MEQTGRPARVQSRAEGWPPSPNLTVVGNIVYFHKQLIIGSHSSHWIQSNGSHLSHWKNYRHGPKGGVINYQKSDFSLRIDILLHNWASKWIYSIRYDAYLCFLFWMPRKHLYLRPQNHRRSRPPKAADFVGRFFVFCTDVSWASKIKNIDKHHIQWNIFILRPNCVIKYRFSRKKHIFGNLSLRLRPRSARWVWNAEEPFSDSGISPGPKQP